MYFPQRFKPFLLLLITAFLLPNSSCKARSGNILEFQTKTFQKKNPGCKPDEGPCVSVTMTYPEFTKGAKRQALDKINAEVRKIISKPVPAGKPQTPEAYAEDLFKDYADFRKEVPAFPIGWSVEKEVKVRQPFPNVLSLEFSDYSFLGGAHPNSWVTHVNFNPKTGDPYRLEDLFQTGFENRLNQIAEQIFRGDNDIPPEQEIKDTFFTFEGGQFHLNDNFQITTDGLTFLFNPYEVAPYGMGPVEVVIPYQSIREILKPEWVPASQK